MLKWLALGALSLILMGFDAPTTPDPMVVSDPVIANPAQFQGTLANGSPRSITINPAQKTLVLIVTGQSIPTNITPTLYTPTNSSAVSQLNIYDGAFYPIASNVLGSSYYQGAFGPGNITVRIADSLVSNGYFNQVLLVNVAVGSTSAAQWATSQFTNRVAVAMLRLKAQGITPSTIGVTFGYLRMQGEAELALGTSQSAYTASVNAELSAATAAGFSGRIFIPEETWINGSTYAPVQNAQIALVNNTTIFSGGNLDALGAGDRQPDNTHPNDTGAPIFASTVVTAMHASGSPF